MRGRSIDSSQERPSHEQSHVWTRCADHRPHHARVRADPDPRGGRVRGQAAARVRRTPQRAPRPAGSASIRVRRGQAARLPARDTCDPRRRLDLRTRPGRHSGPSGRDHGSRRPQDDRQRAQLRCVGVHGGLRGRQHAALGQQPAGPRQPARRDPPPHRFHVARRQGLSRSTTRPRCCSCVRADGIFPRST